MDDNQLIQQYLRALHQSSTTLQPLLNTLLTKPLHQQLTESTDPLNTIKLANGSAYVLVSLCFAYLKSQGINTTTHPIMADLARVKSYMARMTKAEKQKDIKEENDDEATKRANNFIRSALGGNSNVIVNKVEPAVSFKGTHTKFKNEEEEDKDIDVDENVAKSIADKIRKSAKSKKSKVSKVRK